MILDCLCCHGKIELAQKYVYHAGFSNVGVAYCAQCGRTLTFSTFDKVYRSIVPDKHPWSLTTEEQRRVDSRLKPCKCGGRFSLREHPRCPYCWCNLSELLGGDICYVRFPGSVDGDEVNVWVAADSEVLPR